MKALREVAAILLDVLFKSRCPACQVRGRHKAHA